MPMDRAPATPRAAGVEAGEARPVTPASARVGYDLESGAAAPTFSLDCASGALVLSSVYGPSHEGARKRAMHVGARPQPGGQGSAEV